MTIDPINKYSGIPMSESISRYAGSLEIDGVSLESLVEGGRDSFGIDGEELVSYVRRCLLTIFGTGAKPVRFGRWEKIKNPSRGSPDYYYIWVAQDGYGETPEEMAETVIARWLSGEEEISIGGLWFALPRMIK